MSTITISLSLYPDDIQELKDILAEGKSCGIIEHILELAANKTETEIAE